MLSLVLVMMPFGADGLEASLRAGMDKLLAEMVAASGGTEQMTQAAATLKASVGLLPGAAGWNWCLRAIASAALAQAMMVRLGYALNASPAYRRMAVPSWFIAVFGASVAIGGLADGDIGFVAQNIAMVMCLPLLLQGLTVVHCGLGRLGNAGMLLAGFYVLALLTAGLSFAVLVSLGLVDHFLKVRERMDARIARRHVMQVILLERIERLGQLGDVVNVKPGFARNFFCRRRKPCARTRKTPRTSKASARNSKR